MVWMKNNVYWFLVISYLACIALTSCSHTDAIPATNSSYAAEDIFIGIAEILLEPSAVIATVYLPLTSEWVSIATDSGTGEYGIEDLAGQTIIPAVYDYLTIIEDNNYVLAIEKGKYGLLDLSG
ncbi:MAG: hypothetical protein FWE76_03705, partial [Symbiobacteriaceae bacterium]|nr:hypothetical protein [Symbiobacteriaceae bacterium]